MPVSSSMVGSPASPAPSQTASLDALMPRATRELIDGGGIYCSRVATAGRYVFLGGPAVDASGGLAPAAAVAPPYHLSPAAHVVAQTSYLYDTYSQQLAELGSSLDELLQVEQF